MEEQEVLYDPAKAKEFIQQKFIEQGDFPQIMKPEEISGMINTVMALDDAFMDENGVKDGKVYDDDAAFDYLQAQMIEKYPEHKMYMMRLVEDYMEYYEQYLDSIGAIEWE